MAGKPRGAGDGKKAGGRSSKQAKDAVKKVLLDNFERIAEELVHRTLGGNTNCLKLLFELADGRASMEDEGTLRRFRSLAAEWAAEPEWAGEAAKEAGEE